MSLEQDQPYVPAPIQPKINIASPARGLDNNVKFVLAAVGVFFLILLLFLGSMYVIVRNNEAKNQPPIVTGETPSDEPAEPEDLPTATPVLANLPTTAIEPTSDITPTPTEIPLPSNVIVYTIDETIQTGDISAPVFYDIDSRRIINPDLFNQVSEANFSAMSNTDLTLEEKDVYITSRRALGDTYQFTSGQFGEWSANGEILPLLVDSMRNTTPKDTTLFFLDMKNWTVRNSIPTATDERLLPGVDTFRYLSHWVDSNRFVFSTRTIPEQRVEESLIININETENNLSTISRSNLSIYGNNEIQIHEFVSETKSAVINIATGNKSFRIQPKGKTFGVTQRYFVSFDGPAYPNTIALDQEENETVKKQLESQLLPRDEYTVTYYSTETALKEKESIIPADGWVTIEAQVRPVKKTIIVHQQNGLYEPLKSRIIEIDPNTPEIRKTLFETDGIIDNQRTLTRGKSFELTNDGDWLLMYSPSEKGKSIDLWSLRTNKNQTICPGYCDNLQVYNSEKFTKR